MVMASGYKGIEYRRRKTVIEVSEEISILLKFFLNVSSLLTGTLGSLRLSEVELFWACDSCCKE